MTRFRTTLASAAGLILALLAPHAAEAAQPPTYDLVLKGGHVLDPANHVNAQRDVAITGQNNTFAGTWVNAAGFSSGRAERAFRVSNCLHAGLTSTV